MVILFFAYFWNKFSFAFLFLELKSLMVDLKLLTQAELEANSKTKISIINESNEESINSSILKRARRNVHEILYQKVKFFSIILNSFF